MNNPNFALITNASGDAGYELSRILAQNHFNLLLAGGHQNILDNMAEEFRYIYDIKVMVFNMDFRKQDNALNLYHEINTRKIQINTLVNLGHYSLSGIFAGNEACITADIINQNITSYVVLSKLFLPDMLARDSGTIWNVMPVKNSLPVELQPLYPAILSFVNTYTAELQSSYKNFNVQIASVLPENKMPFFPRLWKYDFIRTVRNVYQDNNV
ncbi:MAG: SDR family NAD(P)-dependent oxidoreductase [Bacteroidetes bacterium]|nr:SDR family NAD(P)-dependent oxidoreductase [Bacteroidales bacterium]NJO68541.1 SDR family NAD(P)-dependent oxidoreductase [Bacteroidota bacterium]